MVGSLVSELVQSQLALWTLSLSSIFTWLWTSRKRCLLFNVFLLLPASLALTSVLSVALLLFVSLGRLLFPQSQTDSPVPSWVVRRLPQPSSPPLMRRRRSIHGPSQSLHQSIQQHSMRNRRYRALANETSPPLTTSSSYGKLQTMAPPTYFWQRSHSPPDYQGRPLPQLRG